MYVLNKLAPHLCLEDSQHTIMNSENIVSTEVPARSHCHEPAVVVQCQPSATPAVGPTIANVVPETTLQLS